MKRFLKLCLLAVVATVSAASLTGGQANAVVNGNNALQQQGAVSIWNYGSEGTFRHRCTASIISPYWAVTAAHCNFARPAILVPGQTSVRAGSLNNASGYQELGLAAVFVHPNFHQPPDPTPNDPNDDLPNINDIALIKFQHPAQLPSTEFLTLSTSSPAIGAQARAAGWGWHCDDQVGVQGGLPNCGLPYTNALLQTNLEVVPDSRCEYFSDGPTQLCTVGANGKFTMVCRGDSGAPLVQKALDKFKLIGVVSGDGDRIIGHPNECESNVRGEQGTGRFTDVSQYRQWILSTTSNN